MSSFDCQPILCTVGSSRRSSRLFLFDLFLESRLRFLKGQHIECTVGISQRSNRLFLSDQFLESRLRRLKGRHLVYVDRLSLSQFLFFPCLSCVISYYIALYTIFQKQNKNQICVTGLQIMASFIQRRVSCGWGPRRTRSGNVFQFPKNIETILVKRQYLRHILSRLVSTRHILTSLNRRKLSARVSR